MKKFTAALAVMLILVMLVSAISATAKNNFGEVLADYDDYGYYAYFDFENYGSSTHHLAYMRADDAKNADGQLCDPFGFLMNDQGNAYGKRELKTDENGNKYYSLVQTQTKDGDYGVMAVFAMQNGIDGKNCIITEAVELSFKFRMHATQPELATGVMRLINIRRGSAAGNMDHVGVDAQGNVYARIRGSMVKVYENTDISKFLDISFKWYDATNTYTLSVNGEPVVEAMSMYNNYRDATYVNQTYDDDFFVDERTLVGTNSGATRAIEICRGDAKQYGFDIDDIKLARIETAQGGRVYYENTFNSANDGVYNRAAIVSGNNVYALQGSANISHENGALYLKNGSYFALADGTYHLFSQDSFVIEATIKAEPKHESGYKALFKLENNVTNLGILYVDPDGNLYVENKEDNKDAARIEGYKLNKDEALDITVVAIKNGTNLGKFGMINGKTSSSKNSYFMFAYYINGEYVGCSKDMTLTEWKNTSSSAITISNKLVAVATTEVSGTNALDLTSLVTVAEGSMTDANHTIYKNADGTVYYDVEFNSSKAQVRYTTMTLTDNSGSSADKLRFFGDYAFEGSIDNVRVYEGTAPEWYYESVNSANGGKMLDVDFAKLAAASTASNTVTNNGKDKNALGVFFCDGFTSSSLARKTENGSAAGVGEAAYATVSLAANKYFDFVLPVPAVKDGVREVKYSFETTIKNINVTPSDKEFSGQFHLFKHRIDDEAVSNGTTTTKTYFSGDMMCIDGELKLYGGGYLSAGNDRRFALCDADGNQIVIDNDNWNTLRADLYCYDDGKTEKYLVSYYYNNELLYLEDGSAAFELNNANFTDLLGAHWGQNNHRVRYTEALEGDVVSVDVKSMSISAKSVASAEYVEVSEKPFDVDGKVSVIEFEIPNYTNEDAQGYYAVLELRKAEKSFGVIYADAKSGQLAVFYNHMYTPIYTKNGEPITLGDEPASVAVVYDDILYKSRYYVNGGLAYVMNGDEYEPLVDVCFADSTFVYDTRDTSFAVFAGYGEKLDESRYNLKAYGINDGDTAEIIGYQESNVENGIRIVAGVDTLYYSNVGFEVERYENGVFVGSTEVMDDIVYSSIVADNTEISAEKEGYKYLATLSINDLPEDIPENTKLVIRAFTEIEGVKKYDFKAEIAVSNDGYEFVESDDTKVYTKKQAVLLVGQSNMAGRGKLDTVEAISDPRIKLLRNNEWIQMVEPIHTDKSAAGVGLAASFAKAFVEKFDVELALLPAAFGGTSIAQWTKGYSGSTDLDLYENAIAMGKKAQEDGYEICAILWHQGCSNEGTSKYDEKMKVVFDDFITDLELDPEKIVLITGELGEFRPSGSANVSESIAKLAPHYKNYGVATSESLLAIDVTTHFDGPSLRVFGYRYFEIFYKLVTGKKFEFVDDVEYYRVDPSSTPTTPDDGEDDGISYVANVNFNNLTAGTTYTTSTEIGNIRIFPNSKSVQVFAKADNANDKYIGLNAQKDKTPPYVDIVTNYAVGSVIVTEVKFMMSDGYDVSAPAIKLVQSNPVSSIHLLRVGKDGKLYNAVNGTSTTAALVNPANNQTFTLDKFEWTTIKIVADLANNTKDIYVDGVLCGEGLGLCSSASTAASFKVDLTRIMQFDQSNGEGGTMYVDDFKSYRGNESQASNVISCDFDSFEAGTITNTNKDKGVAYFSVGSTVSMAIVEDGSNKYASTSSKTTANDNGYFDVITPATPGNDITIEAKFKLGKYNENSPAICGDLIKLLDPSSTTIALVRLDADGTLRDFVYSGTGKYPAIGDSLGVKLSETEWTTIKVVCRMNENTKDIYINGNLVVKDSALYNTNGAASYETAKTRVMHYKSSGIGTLYVDDFTFTK